MTQPQFLAALAEARPLLWHHAKRMARARATTPEDLVQSAALYLWTVRDRLAAHPNPAGAFVTAGRWAMIRHLQGQARHRAAELAEAHAEYLATTDPEPDEFEALLDLVPADRRELVRERFAGGRTFDDLAAEIGVTPAAVRLRLETVLGHLHERLAG